jgi:triphosphoribosyl-dephospho-CoA synthetase
MKMKLTPRKILDMHAVLSGLKLEKAGAKTRYAVAKNVEILERHVKSIQAALQPLDSPDAKDYEAKRQALIKQFAVNTDGTPAVREDQQGRLQRIIPMAQQSAFTMAVEKLAAEYPTLQDQITAYNKTIEEFLDTEEEVDNLRLIPEILTEPNATQLRIILDLIQDPDAAESTTE